MLQSLRHRCLFVVSRSVVRAAVSTSSRTDDKKRTKITFPDTIHNDWIGAPDPESNMRLMKFHIPADETPAEKEYREMREETQNLNHQFWAKHNSNFLQEKELFIKEMMSQLTPQQLASEQTTNTLISQRMPEFYRKFLDDNYELHRDYNREWYRRTIRTLWPACKVYVQRRFRRKPGSTS